MKRIALSMMIAAALAVPAGASAFDLKDILNKAGSTVGGAVEGLLTQTNITVEQMEGTWTATGAAVSFQSDNALKKAGGGAISGTIEDKIDPYFKKFGLTGSTMTIDSEGAFQWKVKGVTIKGKITKRQDGNFDFSFTPMGNYKLGTIRAYVEKPISGLKIMFDASKLKSLLSMVAGITNNSLVSSASSILDSYDGLCVGFSFN